MEYVPRKEVKFWTNLFDVMINNIRPYLKADGITFIFNLVGSAKRNLVIRHNNKGFDCDYQIYIMKNKKNLSAKEIKLKFISLIDKFKSEEFGNCEDKTRSIKLKYLDQDNSKIIFSYDVVIMRKNKDNMQIIHKTDELNNKYDFVSLKDYSKHNEYYKKITGYKMWNELRKLYYEQKIKQGDKKSFQILHECVMEILKNNNLI